MGFPGRLTAGETSRGWRGRKLPLGVHRVGWGVADQGMSSLGNFALGLLLARSLGARSFGAFTLAYLTYGLVLNASRGVSTDPLIVRFSNTHGSAWRTQVRAASAVALLNGVVAGLICFVIGLLLPGGTGTSFMVLGVALPGLMLQDSWRFALFARGRPRLAFFNDLLWTGSMLGGLITLHVFHRLTVGTGLAAFGGSAALAAAFGLVQVQTIPDLRRVRSWFVEHRSLGPRYLVENSLTSAATQGRALVLGAVASLSGVGIYRIGEMLMGPFLIVLMGVAQVAVPEAVSALASGPARLRRFCLFMGAAQSIAAVLWGAGLFVLLPLGVGSAVFGSLWRTAEPLLLPMMLSTAAASWATASQAGLRAAGRSRLSLRGMCATAGGSFIGGAVGAVMGGTLGAAWGNCIGIACAAVVWWRLLRAVTVTPELLVDDCLQLLDADTQLVRESGVTS